MGRRTLPWEEAGTPVPKDVNHDAIPSVFVPAMLSGAVFQSEEEEKHRVIPKNLPVNPDPCTHSSKPAA